MTTDLLRPSIDLLTQEYVLVQAWKKTASFIRYHNWYSDTLELDRTAVNLPHFISELSAQLKTPDQWSNDRLRIVPAPKSQHWHVSPQTKHWEPVDSSKVGSKLRPLSHVSFKDQVAATAIMLCLANRVETIQGDPRDSLDSLEKRKKVISYGNRLFCDKKGSELYHRWGSAKLYREYYQDYRKFLSRSEIVAKKILPTNGSRVIVVHSDLRQFYDRVRPNLLANKMDKLAQKDDDPAFFKLARHLLNWEWDSKDAREVSWYAQQVGLSDFSTVALPQGLVAAGFFANVALLDFDQSLIDAMSSEIITGIHLDDVCRYVDDLRIVLTIDNVVKHDLHEIEQLVVIWLRGLLEHHADGLKPSDEKTTAATFGVDERPLVRQSRKMGRIQSAVSGGFDAIGGEEILDAIQGLIRTQQRYSKQSTEGQWPFSPIPDVRDATVARFAAARFRTTYRSLRPLLSDREESTVLDESDSSKSTSDNPRISRTRSELDDEAKAFALGLIENWVEDPSNVRLLRIGLDLWPAPDVLKSVLELLRPFTEKGGRRKAPRRVAWYCLSEIFRAGATETGFVEDNESLPKGINIASYRSVLREEAIRLGALPAATLPWYLRQQVLLFLATNDEAQIPTLRPGRSPDTKHYRELIRFLKGDVIGGDFVTLAILARRSYRSQDTAVQLACKGINLSRLEQIAERDPSFALEILSIKSELVDMVSPRVRDDLCLRRDTKNDEWKTLSEFVLRNEENGLLRNEITILQFASKFLMELLVNQGIETITPSDVRFKFVAPIVGYAKIDEVKIVTSRVTSSGSMYHPPDWCANEDRWRFQLGYLLRFILSARVDFTKVVRPFYRKEKTITYRVPDSHCYQRLYGLYSGRSAFGDDWLPISDWIEDLLSSLLTWPGCRTSEMIDLIRNGIKTVIKHINSRLEDLAHKQGPLGSTLILPFKAPSLVKTSTSRPLRACVVQTVIPGFHDFKTKDLTLNDPAIRKQHRNHLSAALAAIERMLDLRETHKGREGRLDWLILPELSVHPLDVKTHLIPFARAHKTIILAGITYEELFLHKPLVNSALWVIPALSAGNGLQVLTLRQGKQHLAPEEEKLNQSGVLIQGFRPCQWLVGYEWSSLIKDPPLWLTASICYDATDLRLVTDLRRFSDVFAIPALNKDVGTFDQMAMALHYHMFQMVIVANNGLYGGSNAYIPCKEHYLKQVFHLHGQPQASIAFLEIDDIAAFINRTIEARRLALSAENTPNLSPTWKSPPAGIFEQSET